MWTKAQTDVWLAQQSATYVQTRDGVEWWRLPNKNWVSRRVFANGTAELRNVACGC